MRLVDLSLEIGPNKSEPVPVEIEYISHKEGADLLGKAINIDHKSFPGQIALSLEHIKLTSHTGTHIDAPVHYGPESEGRKAKTISELPLDWFYGNGVVLDCMGESTDGPVTKEEVILQLKKIPYILQPYDIVLIRTDADKFWGKPEYLTNYRGMTREATAWLANQGIKVIGIDSFGFDAPFHLMLKNYEKTKDPNTLWPAHFYGREKEYCQIERLTNLSAIKRAIDFKIICFPIKIKECGGGWSRVVAVIDD